MNVIKQIEAALSIINDAKFQDMINNLLYLEGYKFVGAPGSVVGKEKTSKGTPDSFFLIGDDYAFVESTTKERLGKSKTFFKKLVSDIEHCFDCKSGIPPERIIKVILACTGKVSPKEELALKRQVKGYNAKAELETYNIQNLPYKLLDHPRLVDRYLNVRTVKGDIYTLQDFLERTTKGLQPCLTNEFVGRKDEINKCLEVLSRKAILLLTGPGGTGKSKLSVSVLERMEEASCQPVVILSSVVPLWDDFMDFFQKDKRYIVLLDDANKSLPNFSYMLSFMEKPENGNIKLIITARDYVKAEIQKELFERDHEEVIISPLKDEDINEIIVKAVPALRYHHDIKRRITALAKGNARMAMMAAYSVVPEAENNYLRSPVLLYEKYFEKLSLEINAFKKPITLQTMAVISFFGQIRRDDRELEKILASQFGIDWAELWDTVITLHEQEVLDVYNNMTVKMSDQVLATYTFYKAFIDPKSAKINYAQWIEVFLGTFAYRIESTLIDVNNTFTYEEIKKCVMPHLDKILYNKTIDLYAFYSIFWFYKSLDALLFITNWVNDLTKETAPEKLEFTYPHNSYSRPAKYFELLVNFWQHGTEYLAPSIELGVQMVAAQPSRLGAFLKFFEDRFKYTFEDTEQKYIRQEIFLETLSGETRSPFHMLIADGILQHMIDPLLGWSYHQIASSDRRSIQIRNFDLACNEDLRKIRMKLLQLFYLKFEDFFVDKADSILVKIIYPGGKIDKEIYKYEIDLYNNIVNDRLSPERLAHCKFVKGLKWHLGLKGSECPETWNKFLDSETMAVYNFMKTDIEDRKGRGWKEIQEEKTLQMKKFVSDNDWPELEHFLERVSRLVEGKNTQSEWQINAALNQLYFAIAEKGKAEIVKAIQLTLAGRFNFSLPYTVLGYVLRNSIIGGKELISIINSYELTNREWLITAVYEELPADECTCEIMEGMISFFRNVEKPIAIHHIKDWSKYLDAFEDYAGASGDTSVRGHNVITYLTQLILDSSKLGKADFGYSFCETAATYFREHFHLLKEAYYYCKEHGLEDDTDGKELESLLRLDHKFFVEFIQKEAGDLSIQIIRGSAPDIKYIWTIDEYKTIINESLHLLAEEYTYGSTFEQGASILFTLRERDDSIEEKMRDFIRDYIAEHCGDIKKMSMIMNIILRKFPDYFNESLRQILVLNKNSEILKAVDYRTKGVMEGSRVPYIQKEINRCNEVLTMLKSLPGVLDYFMHLRYIEKFIEDLKKDKVREEQRDFEESF